MVPVKSVPAVDFAVTSKTFGNEQRIDQEHDAVMMSIAMVFSIRTETKNLVFGISLLLSSQ